MSAPVRTRIAFRQVAAPDGGLAIQLLQGCPAGKLRLVIVSEVDLNDPQNVQSRIREVWHVAAPSPE